ncbi:uncharacterized protein N7496_010726, partial [Penicillium cataractarum]
GTGRRLPIILDTLKAYKNDLEATKNLMSEDACRALEKILKVCDDKAGKLKKEIFEGTMPGEKDKWEERYFKVVRRLGKGNIVEDLMIAITEDVQLIINQHAVNSATPEQRRMLESIVHEMKSLPPSMPEEESLSMSFSRGGGKMTNLVHTGSGEHQTATDHATMYNAKKMTFVTKETEDFNLRNAAGICHGQTPYLESELFVGRVFEISQMTKVLHPGEKHLEQRRLVLGGIGCIGQTQLAIAYARTHSKIYDPVLRLNTASELIE